MELFQAEKTGVLSVWRKRLRHLSSIWFTWRENSTLLQVCYGNIILQHVRNTLIFSCLAAKLLPEVGIPWKNPLGLIKGFNSLFTAYQILSDSLILT